MIELKKTFLRFKKIASIKHKLTLKLMSRMNIEINIFTDKTTYAEAYNYTKELLYYNDKVMNMYKHKVIKNDCPDYK